MLHQKSLTNDIICFAYLYYLQLCRYNKNFYLTLLDSAHYILFVVDKRNSTDLAMYFIVV